MKARGYEIKTVRNGNVIARKGVYIATPTVTALTKEDATDTETLSIIAALTD